MTPGCGTGVAHDQPCRTTGLQITGHETSPVRGRNMKQRFEYINDSETEQRSTLENRVTGRGRRRGRIASGNTAAYEQQTGQRRVVPYVAKGNTGAGGTVNRRRTNSRAGEYGGVGYAIAEDTQTDFDEHVYDDEYGDNSYNGQRYRQDELLEADYDEEGYGDDAFTEGADGEEAYAEEAYRGDAHSEGRYDGDAHGEGRGDAHGQGRYDGERYRGDAYTQTEYAEDDYPDGGYDAAEFDEATPARNCKGRVTTGSRRPAVGRPRSEGRQPEADSGYRGPAADGPGAGERPETDVTFHVPTVSTASQSGRRGAATGSRNSGARNSVARYRGATIGYADSSTAERKPDRNRRAGTGYRRQGSDTGDADTAHLGANTGHADTRTGYQRAASDTRDAGTAYRGAKGRNREDGQRARDDAAVEYREPGTGYHVSDSGYRESDRGARDADGSYRVGHKGARDSGGSYRVADSGEDSAAYWAEYHGPVDHRGLGEVGYAAAYADDDGDADGYGEAESPEEPDERTEVLLNRGRRNAPRSRLARWAVHWRAIAVGVTAFALGVFLLTVILPGSNPTWPSSVATVQHEITVACQNPNVVSEPSEVNFACAKSTRQILWVFSLLTSNDNPNFSGSNGRKGLEPISPAQGGDVAWSLNLHHPYDPANPTDSLEVAARAINNIIGGATLTGSNGSPVVQPGLESNPANCARYTGSSALVTRQGFPAICAQPVSSPGGQAALVSDIFKQWLVGTPSQIAADAGVLFENADNPGDPQVQAILKSLPGSRL